jgi:hypothetical protein
MRLRREAFTGRVWVKASPEGAFSPEVSIDVSRFLERLEKRASDLTVAWAIAENGVGPKVVAYRVRGLPRKHWSMHTSRRSESGWARRSSAWPNAHCGGRRSLSALAGLPSSRGYMYANDDLLFTAWTDHISVRELAGLIPQLPNRTR